jgi:hypothetical protein
MRDFWRRLLGRDALTQRMKALHEIDRSRRALSGVLLMSVFDPEFDEQRRALQKTLDDLCDRLREAVTYNAEAKILAFP